MLQAPHFGLPIEGQGASLYGGASPREWESRSVVTHGLGFRLCGRRFVRKFGDAFKTGSAETTAFNAGARVHFSVSNFEDPGFTYLKGTARLFDALYIDPLCQRIAALPFGQAVSGADGYGGYCQTKIWATMQHEINQKAKIGAYGSSPAATGGEYQNFLRHFVDRLNHFGIRNRVEISLISVCGVDINNMDPFMPGPGIVDEFGFDLYCNMSPASNWHYDGKLDSFEAQIQPGLAWCRKWGLNKLSMPEWGSADSGNATAMHDWYVAAARYMLSVTDIQFVNCIHWAQASNWWQNTNELAAQDTVSGPTLGGHPGKHSGIIDAWALLGNNGGVIVPPSPVGNLDIPTGLRAVSADDGKSIFFNWDPLPSDSLTDQVDLYKQGPADGWLKKDNVTPLPASAEAYPFQTSILPSTAYVLTAVGIDSSIGARTGYGALVPLTTNKPGPTNQHPVIVNASYVQDDLNPLLFHFSASAMDPDVGQTLLYSWKISDLSLGTSVIMAGAAVDHTFAGATDALAVITVKDDDPLMPLFNTQTIEVPVKVGDTFTEYFHMRMLQSGEDIREMGNIHRATMPTMDDLMRGALLAKTPHNAAMQLAASSLDPRTVSTTYTPSPQDLIFSMMKFEDIGSSGIVSLTTRAAIGAGHIVGVWDQFGGLIDSWSLDHLLTQPLGAVKEPFPNPLTGPEPNDLVIVGIWHPPSGVSQQPIYSVNAATVAEALINCQVGYGINVPWFGVLKSVSTFPTQLDFTKHSLTTPGQAFLGLVMLHPWGQATTPDSPTTITATLSATWNVARFTNVVATLSATWNVLIPYTGVFNSFASPASGTTLTAGSGANADGSRAWDDVFTPAGSTLATSTTHYRSGSQSLKIATGATSGICGVQMRDWNSALTAGVLGIYCRAYIYLTALPTSGIRLFQPITDTNAVFGQMAIPTNGKLVMFAADGGTNMGQMTGVTPLNQWVRIEFMTHLSTTAGYSEIRRYDSPESSTATETLASTHAWNTQGTAGWELNGVRVGLASAVANNGPFWIDDVAFSEMDWLGAAA